jgi:ABC-type multidrug transport system ATPase subunit
MMIQFESVFFSYEKSFPVLTDVSLKFPSGLSLIVGSNGCGKSTLLKLAAGVEFPDTGRILINGHDLWKEEILSRQKLAYLPEHPDITPYATLKEILDLVCRLRGVPEEKGAEALVFFDLEDHSFRTIRQLSKGQRKRAAFSTLLVGTPECILLDEPMEGMDRRIQKDIFDWIRKCINAGAAVVLVSHAVEPFLTMASQIVTIKNGRTESYSNLPSSQEDRLKLMETLM